MVAPPSKLIRHPDYATVERTVRERNDELRERHGAHHIGVSKKYRRGKRLPETCVTFYVKRKGKDVKAEPVPKHLELSYESGVRGRQAATDVCAIGWREPAGFEMRGGDLVIAGDGETGTVGLVFRQGASDFFLTNAHVATDPGAPPGRIRVRARSGRTVHGVVQRMDDLTAPLVMSDAALVRVPANSVTPKRFHGTELALDSCGEVANNDPRKFYYVAEDFVHVLRWRASIPAATPIRIDGHLLRYAGFHAFDVTFGRCRPGHSGAVVFCASQRGLTAVGLLFGGIQATNEVWVFPVRLALAQMGVDPDSLAGQAET
ncbi:hypothetical protein ABUE31_14530 [Mesorhizobium sp. ZMM04-5]|uniref:Serine protease n=1 Tax=Mesorhizobium marinum TaxID=3228790 RepID=A0ABV3R1V3_9HYPH